jgi:ankyrin repeat protein
MRAAIAFACLIALLSPASAQIPPSASEMRVYAGLHAATAKGDAAEIERLIVAAHMRHHAAARALLRLRANPNALDAQRYDIVTIASVNDDVEMLKLALDGGASARNITSPYDGTALIAAAHLGHAGVVRVLIDAKAPLDHVNNLGWTALIESIVLGNGGRAHTDTLAALVKAGANVNLADRQGTTPLGLARQRGYAEMVRILEEAGGR